MRTPPALLAITPGAARDREGVRALLGRLERALGAGLPGFSLREGALPDALLLELAREARVLAAESGAWVGVHDAVHVALAASLDGVHLGRRSLPVEEARAVCGGRLALGFSAHADDAPRSAPVLAADYVTFGPVRAPRSKESDRAPTGLEGLARFAAAAPRPVLALGGLGPEDFVPVREAGGAGLAAISAVFEDPDPAAAVAALVEAARGGAE